MKHSRLSLVLALLLVLAACGGGGGVEQAPAPDINPAPGTSGSGALNVTVHFAGPGGLSTSSIADALQYWVRLVSPKQATRRIEPGDIPSSVEIGHATQRPDGGWNIDHLPAGQYELVQVSFYPKVDLATGLAVADHTYQAAVNFPVQVPASGALKLTIGLSFTANPRGGYFVDGALLRSDTPAVTVLSRLDYAASTVTRDNDGDGDFSGEPLLPDPEHLGVSRPLLERLEALNTVGATAVGERLFTAQVAGVTSATGAIQLLDVQPLSQTTGDEATTNTPVRFTEETACVERTVRSTAQLVRSVEPQQFLQGERVTLAGQLLPDGQGGQQLWLSDIHRLTLDLPPDTIVALPDKHAARAGEAVPVTVYVNRTAQPLREVRRLRISFDSGNRYLPGSLDPGDRGGGNAVADGVWAGMAPGVFSMPSAGKVTSGQAADGRAYVELSLAPQTAVDLPNASGALCNFELICHEDAALGVESSDKTGLLTAYVNSGGGTSQWTNCLKASKQQVVVSGRPLELALLPATGSSLQAPALVAPGSTLRFRLYDPLAGDVSNLPAARFYVELGEAGPLELTAPTYQLPADFHGPVQIDAAYADVYCEPATKPSVFVDDPAGFVAALHAPESCVFGGSIKGLSTEIVAEPQVVRVLVNVDAAQHLHALYFKLNYNAQLYSFSRLDVSPTLRSALLVPPYSFLQNAEGELEVGLPLLHPQDSAGIDHNGTLLELIFTRLPLGAQREFESAQVAHPPSQPSALLAIDAAGTGLNWQPYLAGDYNQDGHVQYALGDATGLTDWTCLAMQLNKHGVDPDSPGGVIDRVWNQQYQDFYGDGAIDLWCIDTLVAHRAEAIDSWRVYFRPAGASAATPGSALAEVPYSAHSGDPAQSRISFSWRSPAPLEPGQYWLVPLCAGVEGVACPAVAWSGL